MRLLRMPWHTQIMSWPDHDLAAHEPARGATARGEAGFERTAMVRAVIPVALAGLRADQALAWVFPEYSRTTLKAWILAGRVQVDGRCVEPRHVVSGGEKVELAPPPPSATLSILGREHPQAIPIEVIHEDPEIRVVNKPAGLVVHPGAGNREGTLLNALLHLDPGLADLPRAGIVHRLDKDTSGLLVIARSPRAYRNLVTQIKARRIARECGLLLGISAAAGISASLKIAEQLQLRKDQQAVLVTILCDSGDKYLSERFWTEK